MVKLLTAYDNTLVAEFDSLADVEKYIGELAARDNYGIFRMWREQNVQYYDTGRVYKVIHD